MVEPSTAVLGPGQIRDANRLMLLAAAAKAGAEVRSLSFLARLFVDDLDMG